MILAQEMRPQTFEEVIGNSHIVAPLRKQLSEGNLNPSLLITGETGTGKTTIAHLIARELESEITEIDCGSDGGVDTIRGVLESATHTSLFSANKVFILDEAHKLGTASQSALLRALETPQSGVYFILVTNEPGKLLATVRTRCLHYATELPGNTEIGVAVNRVIERYGLTVENKKDFWEVIRQSEGSLRQVYSLLEKLLAASDDEGFVSTAAFNKALAVHVEESVEETLLPPFKNGNLREALNAISQLQKSTNTPYGQLLGTYNYLRKVLVGVNPAMMADIAALLSSKDINWFDVERIAWKHLASKI